MREGGKKTFKKKNIEPIFGKVNEGDEIKKTLDIFLKKLMRATKSKKLLTFKKKVNEGDEKKQAKKHSWKNIFYLFYLFSECFFYLPKLTVFFGKSATI